MQRKPFTKGISHSFSKTGHTRITIGQDRTTGQAFVRQQDRLPVVTLTPFQVKDEFTGGSYPNSDPLYFQHQLSHDAIAPVDAQIVAKIEGRVQAGTDETVSLKLMNRTDNEAIASVTGLTGDTSFSSSWSNFDPTTTDSPVQLMIDRKTEPNVNQSALRELTVHFAIQL